MVSENAAQDGSETSCHPKDTDDKAQMHGPFLQLYRQCDDLKGTLEQASSTNACNSSSKDEDSCRWSSRTEDRPNFTNKISKMETLKDGDEEECGKSG